MSIRTVISIAVILALFTPALAQEPGGLRVQLAGGRSAGTAAPAWDFDGVCFVPLRPIAEYFGGSMTWVPATHKAVLQGAHGHKAFVTVGNPKLVLDGRHLVRLPNLPRLYRSQLLVTPETFQVVWQNLGYRAPAYLPETRTLQTGDAVLPAAPGVASGPAAAQPVATNSTRLRCVVVDAGHGGKDPGAIGPSHLREKDVTLEIALALARRLEAELGCKVILTRRDDRFVPLPERPEIANRAQADLFVSVHANASPDPKATGSQVFIYNREATSRKAAETARLENRDTNYLEMIKDDLRQSVHEADSITAAGLISQELERSGQEARHIERAPFYVLARSHMPSILVETAFITNRGEESKLRRQEFCAGIAQDISRGIREFAREGSGTAGH